MYLYHVLIFSVQLDHRIQFTLSLFVLYNCHFPSFCRKKEKLHAKKLRLEEPVGNAEPYSTKLVCSKVRQLLTIRP
jgi:hypothetical protein